MKTISQQYNIKPIKYVSAFNHTILSNIAIPMPMKEWDVFIDWTTKAGRLHTQRYQAFLYFSQIFGNLDYYKDKIENGSIIWLYSVGFDVFVTQVLPFINKNVILIYDGDLTFPFELDFDIKELDNPKIKGIFAINNAIKHSKVNSLPIGLKIGLNDEFHFLQINEKKKDRIYADFVFSNSSHGRLSEEGEDRKRIEYKLNINKVIDIPIQTISLAELLIKKQKYYFDECPIGEGYDCYLSW
jgi:hypothetical protein